MANVIYYPAPALVTGDNNWTGTNIFQGSVQIDSPFAATSIAPESSPVLELSGEYWNGSASSQDIWTIQNVIAAGTNGASTLTFSHFGTSGVAAVNAPAWRAGNGTYLSASYGFTGEPNTGPYWSTVTFGSSVIGATWLSGGYEQLAFDPEGSGPLAVRQDSGGLAWYPAHLRYFTGASKTLCLSGITSGVLSVDTNIIGNGLGTVVAAAFNGLTTPTPAGAAVFTQTIAAGTVALGTSLISSGAAATVVTAVATGALATDNLMLDFNSDPTGVTGYTPSTNGMLTIIKWVSAGQINIKVVNNTGASITPGAVTLNWRVVR